MREFSMLKREARIVKPTLITYMDAQLYTAAAKGHNDILWRLSADDLLLQLTPRRNTLLHIASQFGQLGSVQFILQFPSSSSLLQQTNQKSDTALHLAAREGHYEVVKALIHAAKAFHKSGFRADDHKLMMRMLNWNRGTALHEAVRYNHVQVVKLLVEEYPDFTYHADSRGYTPLYMAAERGYGELVKILIENIQSSPAHGGIKGRTALHAAVIRRDLEMTRKILEWKPILTLEVDEQGWLPLHWAAYLPDASITEELLKKSPDKSVIYLGIQHSKRTALHVAASVGGMEVVKLLLSQAPDCSEQVDFDGNNVFHIAMKRNPPYESGDPPYAIFSELLKIDGLRVRGLVNENNNHGRTPINLLLDTLRYVDGPFRMNEIVLLKELAMAEIVDKELVPNDK